MESFGFFAYPKTLILDKDLIIIEIEKLISKDKANSEKNKEAFLSHISNLLADLLKG